MYMILRITPRVLHLHHCTRVYHIQCCIPPHMHKIAIGFFAHFSNACVMAHTHCTGPGQGPGNDGFLYYTLYCTQYTGTLTGTWNHCYCPQIKFVKVMFLHLSVCSRGGSVSRGVLHPGGSASPPIGYYGIWSTSGPYASY